MHSLPPPPRHPQHLKRNPVFPYLHSTSHLGDSRTSHSRCKQPNSALLGRPAEVSSIVQDFLGASFSPKHAIRQIAEIVKFTSGRWPVQNEHGKMSPFPPRVSCRAMCFTALSHVQPRCNIEWMFHINICNKGYGYNTTSQSSEVTEFLKLFLFHLKASVPGENHTNPNQTGRWVKRIGR